MRVRSRQFAVGSLVRSLVRSLALGSLVGSLAVGSACRGPQQPYTSIRAGAAALTQRFNADAGKTRIVILPAPN
jgi:hypothetical protein